MRAVAVVGLGFGDEGKGTTVDWLCRQATYPAPIVVRFNGGAQAAHNVVTDDGRHHCFHQFGAGTFAGARTYMSRDCLFNPIMLYKEAEELAAVGVRHAVELFHVDRDALITTPYHIAANRMLERTRSARHGSTGMGIGETVEHALKHPEDALRAGDFGDPVRLKAKLLRLRDYLMGKLEWLPKKDETTSERRALADDDGAVLESCLRVYGAFEGTGSTTDELWLKHQAAACSFVFEGAQGVLLDETHGFHPHNTWSRCTFAGAEALMKVVGGELVKLGVSRTFTTRHGRGPMPSEHTYGWPKAGASDSVWRRLIAADHNAWGVWQEHLRAGPLDLVLLKYAREVVGKLDGLVMTHLDSLDELPSDRVPIVDAYEEVFEREGERTSLISRFVDRSFPGDYDEQRNLGKWLERVRPYEPLVTLAKRDYANTIAAKLQTPLVLVSRGPRAKDKTLLSSP